MSDVVLCDLLAESGLKTQWLVETYQTPSSEFKRALGSGKVREVDAKDISEGEGYASKVYQREENTREVEQLSLAHFHDIECSFSEAFKGAEGQPLPKVWYTRKPGTSELGVILIEDLSGLGCKKGFMKALNAQQLRNIAREYAFHLCADKNVKAAIDVIPSNTTVNLFAENGEKTLATLKAAIRECKEEFLDKIRRVVTPNSLDMSCSRPKQLGIPLLICQGDSVEHNLFFKKASDGTASNEVCAFLDWQIAFSAS